MLDQVIKLIALLDKSRSAITTERAFKTLGIAQLYEFMLSINAISEQLEKLRSLLPLSDTENAARDDDGALKVAKAAKVAAVSEILIAIQKIFIRRWAVIQGTNNEYFEVYNQLTFDLNHTFLDVATLLDRFFKKHFVVEKIECKGEKDLFQKRHEYSKKTSLYMPTYFVSSLSFLKRELRSE